MIKLGKGDTNWFSGIWSPQRFNINSFQSRTCPQLPSLRAAAGLSLRSWRPPAISPPSAAAQCGPHWGICPHRRTPLGWSGDMPPPRSANLSEIWEARRREKTKKKKKIKELKIIWKKCHQNRTNLTALCSEEWSTAHYWGRKERRWKEEECGSKIIGQQDEFVTAWLEKSLRGRRQQIKPGQSSNQGTLTSRDMF